jgi:hypothetical protein
MEEIDVDMQMTTEIARPLSATVERRSAGTWNTSWGGWFCIGLWKYKCFFGLKAFCMKIWYLTSYRNEYCLSLRNGGLEWKKSEGNYFVDLISWGRYKIKANGMSFFPVLHVGSRQTVVSSLQLVLTMRPLYTTRSCDRGPFDKWIHVSVACKNNGWVLVKTGFPVL